MNGLDFLMGVSLAILVMALVQGVIDHVAGPDPDLRGEPWHPDPDHLWTAPVTEPRRNERGLVWPVRERGRLRDVAGPSESELRGMDGNR